MGFCYPYRFRERINFGNREIAVRVGCPVSAHSEKWVRRSIFCEQLVSLRASINRTGYCSGETVPICAKFENYSSCFVVPKACIYQTQTFLAKGKSKTYKQEVASVRGIPIPPFKTQRWNPNELKIPSITASILNSTIIRVEYSLVTLLEIPDSGLAVDLPIVIGTIPIQQSGYGTGSNASGQYSADLSPLTLALPQPLKAPPTYEGTVSGRECEPHAASASHLEKLEREFGGQLFSYIEGMRFQPPPRFSEVGLFAAELQPDVRRGNGVLLCRQLKRTDDNCPTIINHYY
ncbi:arrestin domain-containing protein 4-like [Scleropages formosus]|uniref:arrestin domain-containing protein 4-like n=1 Tax=Scleropages formosus TaxID=113540 RepID=UPI0010FA888C|nr:arrestin domain-containing protein 4-like [Scleropages formosus]